MNTFTDYDRFSKTFVGFSNYCRAHKLSVGIHETREAMVSALYGIWGDEYLFKYGLKALFCNSPDEYELFEKLYSDFWLDKSLLVKSKTTYKNQSNFTKPSQATLVMMGEGDTQEDDQSTDAKPISGANKKESLRKTDFTKVAQIDSKLLDRLAEQLWQQMSLRIKRKRKLGKKGQIDLKQTVRKNLQNGGNLIHLAKARKKKQKYKLVILLDVSGSMDKYSFYLLKFIYTLRSNFDNLEAFIFSTRLVRITEFLDKRNLRECLALMSHYAQNWSSGTKIGYCLNQFNQDHAKRVLNGKTMTILLSDGLETGDPEVLQDALRKIKLRTKKLVWLNPLKGMKGYQPIQRGMSAALPELDVFQSAHNLDSLLALEKILMDV